MSALHDMVKADVSLASIKHMFGSEYDEDRIPLLIRAGIDCLDLNIADSMGVSLSPDDVEVAAVEAHDNVVSMIDSIAIAIVSIAVIASKVDMPEPSRAALESIIQLNVAKLEAKFCG